MKLKNILVSIILVLAIGAQIHFDIAERNYMRSIAKNQQAIVQGMNYLYNNQQEISSFNKTEFPLQVKDYLSKITK